MTQRLRELEEAVKSHSNHRNCNVYCLEPQIRLEGYKMALEEFKPVLDAAREYMLSKSTASWVALRDGLAGLEE